MPKRAGSSTSKELRKVETYEYLLVEYIKEISNEMTYLVLIITSLFLFVMMDSFSLGVEAADFGVVKLIFILMIVGGFALFGLSNITKRTIEKKFEDMLA